MLARLRELHTLGLLEAAEASLRRILDDAPRYMHALLGLGFCARLRGDDAAALVAFEFAFKAHPTRPEAALEFGTVLSNIGRLEEADAVLVAFPDHFGATVCRGITARKRGDVLTALSCFERARTLFPTRATPLNQIILTLREQGRQAEAIAVTRSLAALGPEHTVSAERSIGITYRQMGNHEEALASFIRATAFRPADPDLMVEMALEYRALGRVKRSVELLNQALMLDPTHLRSLLAASEQCRMLGDAEGNLAFLHRIVTHHSRNTTAWLRLSRVHYDQGNLTAAQSVLNAAETTLGCLPEIKTERIRLLQESGLWQEALTLARIARTGSPLDFNLWHRGLQVELLVGSADEIRLCLDLANPITASERSRVLHGQAMLADREGRLDDAVTLGDLALAEDPGRAVGLTDLLRFRLFKLDLPAARQHLDAYAKTTLAGKRMIGKSGNASQNFFGQIYNEFALDREAFADLVNACKLPIQTQIGSLVACARRRPDHIPTAIMIMLALRKAGCFDLPSFDTRTCVSRIPAQIGQYWDADELPEDLMALHNSWGSLNPDHTIHLFNHNSAIAFLNTHFPPEVGLAYMRSEEPTKRADIFRLAYLWVEGGFWVDIDDRAVKPLATFVPPEACAVFWQEQWGTLGNNFMGVIARMPLIGRALLTVVSTVNRGDADLLWLATGPGLITRAFVQEVAGVEATGMDWLKDVRVFERFRLYKSVAFHCRTSHKKSQKHWSDSAYGGPRKAAPRLPDMSQCLTEKGSSDFSGL
jgi:tetratricopeptide (TPR) repeat protein